MRISDSNESGDIWSRTIRFISARDNGRKRKTRTFFGDEEESTCPQQDSPSSEPPGKRLKAADRVQCSQSTSQQQYTAKTDQSDTTLPQTNRFVDCNDFEHEEWFSVDSVVRGLGLTMTSEHKIRVGRSVADAFKDKFPNGVSSS